MLIDVIIKDISNYIDLDLGFRINKSSKYTQLILQNFHSVLLGVKNSSDAFECLKVSMQIEISHDEMLALHLLYDSGDFLFLSYYLI